MDMTGRFSSDDTFSKTKFSKMEFVFDLSSFGLQRTEKKWFASNRIMRNMSELVLDMDSVRRLILTQELNLHRSQNSFFSFHFKKDSVPLPAILKEQKRYTDSINLAKFREQEKKDTARLKAATALYRSAPSTGNIRADQVKVPAFIRPKEVRMSDSLFGSKLTSSYLTSALSHARRAKSEIQNTNAQIESFRYEFRVFEIQWHKIMANSIACLAMFLIGAPLGAIIKKGGLGVPVIASIFFFIVYYVLSLMGEKWARSEAVPIIVGMWLPNVILFVIGAVFLRQARADARLFDADFYSVMFDKIRKRLPRWAKAQPVET
jgi:lipopolysaccharide export system permease protein